MEQPGEEEEKKEGGGLNNGTHIADNGENDNGEVEEEKQESNPDESHEQQQPIEELNVSRKPRMSLSPSRVKQNRSGSADKKEETKPNKFVPGQKARHNSPGKGMLIRPQPVI